MRMQRQTFSLDMFVSTEYQGISNHRPIHRLTPKVSDPFIIFDGNGITFEFNNVLFNT